MQRKEEGTHVIDIYFFPGVSNDDRIEFVHFITRHLQTKGIDIKERISLYCPKCGTEVIDQKIVDIRIEHASWI